MVEEKHKILLINIYGPNRDDPEFYKNIDKYIDESEHDFMILTGDFNLVQDPEIDYYNYRNINNQRARDIVLNIKSKYNLIDPWRVNNHNRKKYTWQSQNPVKKARLDFFLISSELLSLIENTEIKPGYRTDHSIINLNIKFSNFKRGKGFWRFNNTLLKDKEYLKLVNETITEVKLQYATTNYERNEIQDIDPNNITLTIDDQLFLETLIVIIRGNTISYSTAKKRELIQQTENLEKKIEKLENHDGLTEDRQNELRNLKKELEQIRENKMKAIMMRVKAKWIEEGEKPTKYFCSLEKRNYINKTVTKIIDSHGVIITEQTAILKEIETFYSNLYKSKDDTISNISLEELLNYNDIPKLTVENANTLEGKITYKEASTALKNMKNFKSPGPDGFTSEFYKVMVFRDNCPHCQSPCDTNMKVVDIPHFKEVVIMSTNCEFCGVKENEVKGAAGIEPKGTKIKLKITDVSDLSRDVLKSETCTFSVPELDFTAQAGTMGGKFTTVEGIFVSIKDQLVGDNPFMTGDSSDGTQINKIRDFCGNFDKIISGEMSNIHIILDDPAGNSYLQNVYAPDDDPEMEVVHYERSYEQNDELGLNDMNTENYRSDS
ncbi:hypothetical protein FSP39_015361 [Pinctada imbricata]|uniref:Zinc finger ZPR1-type domain-containing protein n=1 Tax=Pinctada imbricata TaxID=66713 RepID=A0AA88YLS1_PINIB|nr:hypothetical protein FSP39_015361 [Pinctada imbricata]